MKNINKLFYTILACTIIFSASNLKAQDTQDSKIGLTVGLDYISNYIYRSQYYYFGNQLNGGMFAPYASYDVFDTGLSMGIKGEVNESWIWNNNDELQNMGMENWNSLNFNINYMYHLKEAVIFNLGSWYGRYKTLQQSSYSRNISYFDFYFSAAIDALPLTPMLAVTYTYLTDKDYAHGNSGNYKNGDFYVQLGISHSFELDDETYLDLDAVVGWYDKNAFDGRESFGRTKSADISDIDLSAGLTTTYNMLTFSSSFHYVIVPGTQYKYFVDSKDIHKFYAKFGVSCSI